MVDVRCLRQVGRSVGKLAGRRHVVAESSEGLVDRCRLDDSLVGEL